MTVIKSISTFAFTILCAVAATSHAQTDISTVPLNTYSAPASTDVKPNVMFVLDDSGSMAWDFMPDWACGAASTENPSCGSVGQQPSAWAPLYLYRNAAYNGLYYNPAIRYLPPTDINATGDIVTTTYPSMTGTTAAATGVVGTGADSSAKPNWKAVKNNAFIGTGTSDLQTGTNAPSFYTMIPGEYCALPNLKTCIAASAPSSDYKYPATVRWCDSNGANCRATFNDATDYVRAPAPRIATLTVSGSAQNTNVTTISVGSDQIFSLSASPTMTTLALSNADNNSKITSIKVNGNEILSAQTATSSSSNTLAAAVATNINKCTLSTTGSCATTGFYAVASGASVYIYSIAQVTFSPNISKSGNVNVATSAFALPNSSTLVAQMLADAINRCSSNLVGSCTAAGYSATSSSSVVTIMATRVVSSAPSISNTGMTITATAFAPPIADVLGENIRTNIIPSINSYPYPGTNAKAAGRTDCVGTTCTYNEEMTNYANWWTYYRTRMQLMKTAASNAFAKIDADTDLQAHVSRFRLGYITLNNNNSGGQSFLNLNEFAGSQKYNWYRKLFAAQPGDSTPLRAALANVGRLYAGKLDGGAIYGVNVVDPLQFSCQQNYTVLSTDGFWTGDAGYKLDGSTLVGNQDANDPAPYTDGTSAQAQVKTSQLQQSNAIIQTRTTNLQKSIGKLQTSTDGGNSWSDVSSCTVKTSNPTRRCRYQWSPYSDTTATCTNSGTPSSNNGTVWNGNGSQCAYGTASSWNNIASCTAVAKSTSSPYTVTTAVECRTNGYDTAFNVNSCTANATTKCAYTAWSTNWSDADSCTAVAQSANPNYTVGLAKQCRTVTTGATSDTLADVAAYYYKTDLRSPDQTAGTGTCVGPVIAPSTQPNDLCADNVPPNGLDKATTQHMTTFTLGLGAQGQMIYAPNNGTDYWADTSGDFYDVLHQTTANSATGICSWQSGGKCRWPTPASNSNANIDDLWHAAINGHGTYYSAADPSSLATGLNSALATIVNTPRPGTAAAAAASNPNVSQFDNFVFSSSYQSVLWTGELMRQQIQADGSFTAENWFASKLLDCATTPWTAATSYKIGDNYRQGTVCYNVIADYVSATAYDSSSSGVDRTNTVVVNLDETAEPKVAATARTFRTIYTKGATGLISFSWSTLSDDQKLNFTTPKITYSSTTAGLSQFCTTGSNCLTAADQNNAKGESLVNFLRGDRSHEDGSLSGSYFRKRTHILGDIVSSEGRYVKTPLFNYADANYGAYKTAQANRVGMVYVGANDGMLHAFAAETGQEEWAYVPSFVLPHLYHLADKKYSTDVSQHKFYVDASPETGDICPTAPTTACSAAQWKTILVGGLNRGGKGYYALDITNPSVPTLLWEFTDANLGYSYSNPRITKLKTGQWVVIIASGYNNADGVGHLYVLDANTGAPVSGFGTADNLGITTGVGTPAAPSGLAKISAHVPDPMTDNTTTAVYGGDLLGNLWRFDVNNDKGAAGYDAQLLVSFQDAAGNAQPITTKPLEATINNNPVVFVGTGRYLGVTDTQDKTSRQTFYAVMDRGGSTTYGNPRTASSNFVQQTITSGTCPDGSPITVCTSGQNVRTSSSNPVNWTSSNGWYVDFANGGERATTDPQLGLGTLVFTTITPSNASSNVCGADSLDASASLSYSLDYLTGGAVVGSNGVVAVSLGAGLATRPVLIRQADGTVRVLIRTSGSSTQTVVLTPPIKPPNGGGVKRVSWRELTTK